VVGGSLCVQGCSGSGVANLSRGVLVDVAVREVVGRADAISLYLPLASAMGGGPRPCLEEGYRCVGVDLAIDLVSSQRLGRA
jgi:hypothetical protein